MRGTLILLAGILLAAPCALALNPALEINQYAHHAWKNSDGFAKGPIYSIAQTPDGYLWLGTDFGLLRFDGVRLVPWEQLTSAQLPDNNVRKVLSSRDGTLWIGTRKGLASWKGGKLTRYVELADQQIMRILEDHEGTIWVGGFGSPTGRLCAIRAGSAHCSGEDGRFGSSVYSLYEYKGLLWVGAATGLWRWEPGPPKLHPVPGAMEPAIDLIEGNNGALWIVTSGGIKQLVDGKVEAYSLPGVGQFSPYKLLRDRDGGLWIGTGQGILHPCQRKADRFTALDGLSGDRVTSVFEDMEGNVWAATTEGLDRFRDFTVPTVFAKQGSSIASVLAARDGSVWLATGDGLGRWRNGQITIYRRRGSRLLANRVEQRRVREIYDEGLADNVVAALLEDDRGRIWVSTRRGISYFEDGRLTPVGPVSKDAVLHIAEEGGGNLWVSDQDTGLFHLREVRVIERVPWANVGHEDTATALIADRVKGGLWLGFFRGGLVHFQDGRVRAAYATRDGLGGGRVNDLHLDREGILWAATESGLSRLKDGRIATLTSKNGLPCDAAQWSMEDNDGSVWVNMPCGLVSIARTELDGWVGDPNRTIKAACFDTSDGVWSIAGAGAGLSPKIAKSIDGKLWFVNYPGVAVIDPRHLPVNKLQPPVHIEQITADRKVYDVASNPNLRLPPLVRDLQIDYTAPSLVAPEKIRFRYKLEGHDRDWHDVGNRRQAFYNDLPPRNYRFRVIACNNSGVWNEAGASFDFSIEPKFYQTGWFLASCVTAVLAILWGVYRLRLLYVTQQFNLRLEERVAERTRIARDFHDTTLQSFQAVLMMFSAVANRIKDQPEAKEQLETIVEQARQAVTEGRDAVQGLRSSTVVTNELARAMSTLGEELTAGLAADQAGPRCPEFRVRVAGTIRDLAPLVRDDVHRIACEAVRNAFRHAQASRIEVGIHYDRRQFRLRVVDNGKGIDESVAAEGGRTGHYGLSGMRERAKLVGGELALLSRRDSGTEVELTIPAALAYTKSPVTAKPMSPGEGT